MSILIQFVIALILGAILNVWLFWAWAFLIAFVIVFGGVLIIDKSDNIFD